MNQLANYHIHVCPVCRADQYHDGPVSECHRKPNIPCAACEAKDVEVMEQNQDWMLWLVVMAVIVALLWPEKEGRK